MVQHAALKMLAESNLNADSSFTLQFNSKCDARELRPVNYSGRVVVSNALGENEFRFRQCELMRQGRTEVATMLPGKEMLMLEDDDDEGSLPMGDVTHAGPRGPRRNEQIGVDGCAKLLDACLDKVSEFVEGWMLVSLHPNVGHDVEAFILKRITSLKPAVYWALCETETHKKEATCASDREGD